MIVWLASYPRSGNTFLRMLLRHGLGVSTYSLHAEGDDRDFGAQEGLADIVGHVTGLGGDALLERARTSSELHIIKTHQPPLSDDKAIYVIRDGRSAIVSFFHYFRDRQNPKPMEEIILDMDHFGSWSSHFHAWQPLTRPNTLFVRFEDVIADPKGAVEKIGAFIGFPILGDFSLSFGELNSRAPKFFRSGDNSRNIAEMEPYIGQFALAHGELMADMGYMSREEVAAAIRRYALELSADRHALPHPDVAEPGLSLSQLYDQGGVIEANAHERYAALYGMLSQVLTHQGEMASRLHSAEAMVGQLRSESLSLKRLALLGLLNRPLGIPTATSNGLRAVLGTNASSKVAAMSDSEIDSAIVELARQSK